LGRVNVGLTDDEDVARPLYSKDELIVGGCVLNNQVV